MNLLARFFKFFFKFSFVRKRYYGIYKRIFKPLALFNGITTICNYYNDLKVKVNLDDWIQQQIYFLGVWDEPGTNFIINQLKPGQVFIDIGANIGSYSLVASKLVGDTGKVYAFEPIPEVFDRLRLNIELNNLTNIEVIQKAVYEKSESLKLYVSANENLGMSGIFHHDTESGEVETADAISLDEFISLKGIERVDMIKIDIEGGELYALKGMKKTIERFRPVILMEISEEILNKNMIKMSDIIDFFKECNYIRKGLNEKGVPVDILNRNGNSYTNNVFLPVKR